MKATARLIAVALTGLVASVGCARKSTSRSTPRSHRPNVLLVTLDTTRADHLGCYGYGRPTSPHLDALAAEGIRFDLAIAQAASTPVSHASILTGLNPYQHGLRVIYAASGYRLPDAVPTLATVLGHRGWATGAVLSSFTVSEFFGLDRGFDHFDNGLGHASDDVLRQRADGAWMWQQRPNQRRSDETTDRAIAWLERTDRPFFLWVHYWDPHDLFLRPPDDFVARFKPSPSAGPNEREQALYDAEIAFLDAQFGRVIEALKRSGIYDNTVIVVVADHGQGLGDHGWRGHRIIYQEQIRVPLILRLPGGPAGHVVSDLVRTIDVYPTVLEALDVDGPGPVEGLGLDDLIHGRPDTPRFAYADAILAYDLNAAPIRKQRPDDDLLYCLMDRSWKLIYRPTRPERSELYDLSADPTELHNRYHDRPEQALRLQTALEKLDPFVAGPFGQGYDREVLERLRSLGYVGDE
ncbi:MAG: sulfatase [Planctomycetes bacterium]|nr:sulfatase [Planctomycetota bacterium]